MRLAEPTHGNVNETSLSFLIGIEEAHQHLGFQWARTERVDPDSFRAEVGRQVSNRRFQGRYTTMERLAADQGMDFTQLPLTSKERFWQEAKRLENIRKEAGQESGSLDGDGRSLSAP